MNEPSQSIAFDHPRFRFLRSLSFERWLLTWLSVLLAHIAIYLVGFELINVLDNEAIHRAYFLGFALPIATSSGALVLAYLNWKRSGDMRRWSDGMIAWHFSLALVLFLLSHAGYFRVPLGAILGALNALSNAELAEQSRSALNLLQHTLLLLILVFYSLGLLLTLLFVHRRLFFLAGLQAALLVGLLLAMPLSFALQSHSGSLQLSQPNAPDVFFAWQAHADGCVDYSFAAEGVRAIWLGEDGLASVEPMNYGRYCDTSPRVLRIITRMTRNTVTWWATCGLGPILVGGGKPSWQVCYRFLPYLHSAR
ncbi:MAG: hypothetical protein RML73_00930 [Anaerolineae bacterium]|nr:hypothetical protein [Anaerolineae bacterium]